jgi:outer membrane protein assembly factor BamB
MTRGRGTIANRCRRTALLLAAAAVVASAAVPAVAAPTSTALTDPDPHASTAYQLNPSHDGGYSDPDFSAPLKLAWSVDLGDNTSYPVIADGRVFVTSGHYNAGSLIEARALDTGTVLWGPKALGSVAMLTYDAGQVFAVDVSGRMTAFDASTGAQSWVVQLPLQSFFTSAPTASNGTVYVGGAENGGTLYAVDEATGAVKWTAGVANGDNSSPAVGSAGVFVSYACEQTYGFALDGSPLWHYSTGCEGGGGRTPVLHGGDLYVRDAFGAPPAIIDAATGALVGTFASTTAPAFDGGFMATQSSGTVAGWDASGTRVWQSSGSDYVTAPLIANGYVVVGRGNGTIDLLREQDGTVVWSGSAGSTINPVDEHDAVSLVGLTIGDGALAVPAGTRLSVFVPAAQTLSITSGPRPGQHIGSATRFAFSSNVIDASFVCTLDGHSSPCTSPVSYTGLANGTHTFAVSVARSAVSPATRTFVVDLVPPTVYVGTFHPPLTQNVLSTLHWRATDASGVAAYQLRTRRGTGYGPLSSWTVPSPTKSTSATFSLPPNRRLCVEVRAEDRIGNWSHWSTARCVLRSPD